MKRLLCFSVGFWFLASALAVKTERWEIRSTADFLRGKLQGLMLTSDGEMRLGYRAHLLGQFGKEIWCSTTAGDGTIYFGTGSPAELYAVDGDQRPIRLATADAVAITALVCHPEGHLYAASIADGKIYKIAADKKWAEFCRLPSPYVWALALDKDGSLFAATGPHGKIYRIGSDAKPQEWFAAEDSNLLCLAFDPADGSLLAGGSDRGLLYRVHAKGKASVLHQFAEEEVRALAVAGPNLFVGVNKQKVRRPPQPLPLPRATTSEPAPTSAPTSALPAAAAPQPAPSEPRAPSVLSGALYLYHASGRVDRWAQWENESVQAIAADADGAVLLATAGKGRVYHVPDHQRWELLFGFDSKQALTLAMRNGRLTFVGAGNPGAAWRIEAQQAAHGEYTSEVHDCRFLAKWGKLDWQADGTVHLATRSGNTALPDSTWSAWSEPLTKPPAKILSPPARYIQVRASLAARSNACLRSVTLHLQVQNQKPEITLIETGERPKTNAVTAATPAAPASVAEFRPKPANPLKRIAWRASDKDGDSLVYRLYYRAEGDEVWIPMFHGNPLRQTELQWDTTAVPDGWYRVKVVASDEDCNPVGEALSDEKISPLIKVNNTRPVVAELALQNGVLRGLARSKLGTIRFLEYSVDGTEWRFFAPADGVFDDREEPFAFKIQPPLASGPHTIAVRATDEDGNAGVEKISVRVP